MNGILLLLTKISLVVEDSDEQGNIFILSATKSGNEI